MKRIFIWMLSSAIAIVALVGIISIARQSDGSEVVAENKSPSVAQVTPTATAEVLKRVVNGKTIKLDSKYNGITSIEICNGHTGEITVVSDKDDINKITTTLSGTMYQVQGEPNDGWLYCFSFYKGQDMVLDITTEAGAFYVSPIGGVDVLYDSDVFDTELFCELAKSLCG